MDPDVNELYGSVQAPQEDPVTQAVRDHFMKLYVGQEGKLPSPIGDYKTGSTWKDLLLNSLGALQGARPAVPAMATPSSMPPGYKTPANQPMNPLIGYKPEEVANAYSGRPDMETGQPKNPESRSVGNPFFPEQTPNIRELRWEVQKANLGRALQGLPNTSLSSNPMAPIHEGMHLNYRNAYEQPPYGPNKTFIQANDDPGAAWGQAGPSAMSPMLAQHFNKLLFSNENQMKYELAMLKQAGTPQGKQISSGTMKELLAKDNMRRMFAKKWPQHFTLPDWYK
jgi:hypothetical protein